MTDCLFCKLVTGEVESQKVKETDSTLAFRDINPVAPTHVLVIPKRHVSGAADLGAGDGELLGELFAVIAEIARGEGLEGGWRVVTNVGPQAGQSVGHLHFHLLGGRDFSWPPG